MRENILDLNFKFFGLAALYSLFLYFFYVKYVPITQGFQTTLIPLLLSVLVLTVCNLNWGTLLFVFCFPLVNNLPYVFGIFEDTPHAPTALVLFLFYFLGWLLHRSLHKEKIPVGHSILKPMIFFSLLVVISAMVSIFRYSNFFPFLSDTFYEFFFNVNGVSAGGAVMSVVFSALNYLSGFAFLFILLYVLRSEKMQSACLMLFLLSSLIAIVFGYFQSFFDISLGNTPFNVRMEWINSTFKDSMSFGAFLSAGIPLFFGLFLFFKKIKKIIPLVAFSASFYILLHTGSLSSIFSLLVAAIVFIILTMRHLIFEKLPRKKISKRAVPVIIIGLIVVFVVASSFILSEQSSSFSKWKRRVAFVEEKNDWNLFLSGRLSYFWELALEMGKDFPLSGVGVGSYIIELPNYATLFRKESRTTDSAENYFLQVLSELGIFGLILSFWIFWEIFKGIRTVFKSKNTQEHCPYVQIGAISGLVALMMSYLIHTYIGSYEIKYTFWLFTALIFSSFPQGFQSGIRKKFSKSDKWIGRIGILLFSVAFLYSSFNVLSLEHTTKCFDIKHEFGLYSREKTSENQEFRWTRKKGGLTVDVVKPILEIPIQASHPRIHEEPVVVEIFILTDHLTEKRRLDRIVLDNKIWKTLSYDLSEVVDKEVFLLFKVSRTWNPQKSTGVQDPRDLGVAVGKITFRDKDKKN